MGRSFAQKPEYRAEEGNYATTDFEDATANNNRAETRPFRSAGKSEEAALHGPTFDSTKEWFDPRMTGRKTAGRQFTNAPFGFSFQAHTYSGRLG